MIGFRSGASTVLGTVVLTLSLASPFAAAAAPSAPTAPKASAHYRPTGTLAAVSCVSASWCRAVNAHGTMYAWDGHDWSVEAQVGPNIDADKIRSTTFTYSTTGLSCTSTSFCMLTYEGDQYSGAIAKRPGTAVYRHGSWHTTAPLPRYYASYELSCSFHGFCMQLGYEGGDDDEGADIYRVWDGSRWQLHTVSSADKYPTSLLPYGLDCLSSTRCVTTYARLGNARYPVKSKALLWNGKRWQDEPISSTAANHFTSVSCPTHTFCAAVTTQGYGFVRHDGGRWGQGTKVVGSALHSVSCPSSHYCVAVGTGGTSTVWDGKRWTPGDRIGTSTSDAGPHMVSVSCPRSYTCRAVSDEGAVYRRGSAGTWLEEYSV